MNELTFDESYEVYRSRIERYFQAQFKYTLHDAEDLTAEVFIVLYQKWNEFDSHEKSAISAFLYKTATNKATEFQRKQRNQPTLCDLDDVPEENLAQPTKDLDHEEENQKYKHYIDQIKAILSPKERITFQYMIDNDCDAHLVAKELNTNVVNVRVRWCRIRRKIAQMLPSIFSS